MDTYIIKKAYHWTKDRDIEIKSENLIFAEAGNTHSGCQSANISNNDEIHKRCAKIAELIREIEDLNSCDGKQPSSVPQANELSPHVISRLKERLEINAGRLAEPLLKVGKQPKEDKDCHKAFLMLAT